MRDKFRRVSKAMVICMLLSGIFPAGEKEAEAKPETQEDHVIFSSESRDAQNLPLEEGTYAEHQVLVRYEKQSVQAEKGTKKRLRQVRQDRQVSEEFGTMMDAFGKSSDIATTAEEQKEILGKELDGDYRIEDSIDFGDYVVSLVSSATESTEEMIKMLSSSDQIRYVTPNYTVCTESADFSLDDPYIGYSYALADETATNQKTGEKMYSQGTAYEGRLKDASMNATDLWKAKEGETFDQEEIVVAVIDSGIDYTHEELADHMWKNPGNIGLTGTYGYDFSSNDDDPMDENGHGTHCAGIIAAQADNGAGIAGVTGKYADLANIKIMALRAFDAKGVESTEFAVLGAFRYILAAIEGGVNVRMINNSWMVEGPVVMGSVYDEVIERIGEKGALSFFAAGNSGADLDKVDASPVSSSSDYIVCVGSMNQNGEKAEYSNYGKSQVDLFAPGSNILSSISFDYYLPAIYTKEQLEKNTNAYGVFEGNDITPVTAGADVSLFGAPVVLNQDGKEVTEGVRLSVSDEKYKNPNTKKSLKVEMDEVKEDEIYYVYFPYQTEVKADGTNVYVAASIGVPNDLKVKHQGYFGVSDMLRFADGTVERPLVPAYSYGIAGAEYTMRDFCIDTVHSYAETRSAVSHGLVVLYKAEKTGPATLYIDALGVSKAGVDSSVFKKYAFLSGTSMSCPYVVGAAALLYACSPKETGAIALKNIILSSVRKSEKLKGYCATDGYLDLSKAISEVSYPAVSGIKADIEDGTIVLTGTNFGTEKGTIACVHAGRGEEVPVADADILSWEPEKLVLRDSKKQDGTYRFRGNYLTFTVRTKTGREGSSTVYLTGGMKAFEKLGKDLVFDKDETGYAGLVTDGSEVYGITQNGSIYWMDADLGERVPVFSVKSVWMQMDDDKIYEKIGLHYYEWNNEIQYTVIGTPVCVEGVIYEWFSVRASDRSFYLGLKMDTLASKANWDVIAMEPNPEKTGYQTIPQNFLYEDPAVCEYKGKIYAIGGDDPKSEEKGTTLVSVFDPSAKTWSVAKEKLPQTALGLYAKESNGRLYAFLGKKEYQSGAADQQPDKRIFCYDGSSWVVYEDIFPDFIKAVHHGNGMISVEAAVAAVGNGIVITGASTDGYGDTFLLDTRKKEQISLKPLEYRLYGGLNTNENKWAAETAALDRDGKQKGTLVVLSEDAEDTNPAYTLYSADMSKEGSVYYQIQIQKKGNGKGSVSGQEWVKKSGNYRETLTVTPANGSVTKSVLVNGKVLAPILKNTYRFTPAGDSKVVVTFALKAKAKSKAELRVKKKTLKKGSSYRIVVQKKNGQKVSFSITAKAKKRGLSISGGGKLTVGKRAVSGTYVVTVLVKESSEYQKKKLKFYVKVK